MTDVVPYEEPDEDALADKPYDGDAAKARPLTTTTGQAAALMLVSGSDFEEIAQILELPSAEVARRITEKAMAQKFDEKDKAGAKRLLLARYEAMFASAKRRADNPKYSAREAATANGLRALGEIARVMGLNEPSEMIVRSPVESEIAAALKAVADIASRGFPQEADVIEGHVMRDEPA